MNKQTLTRNQDGSAIVMLLMTVIVIGLMAWFGLSRYKTEGEDALNSASGVIDEAKETADKAQDAAEKAQNAADKAVEVKDKVESVIPQ